MPSRFRGYCLNCAHQWDDLRWWIHCGPIDFQTPETYRCYFCPRCFVELYVSRRLSRSSWLRWVSENASELTRSPLLFSASELGVRVNQQALQVISRSPLLFETCERVSSILAKSRSRYVPVPIDIGTMACAGCGDPMRVGCVETNLLVCPKCESPSARSISEHHAEVVLEDYSPLKDEEVRRVILHLRELAEYREDHLSMNKLGLPIPESWGPLWDCELDG